MRITRMCLAFLVILPLSWLAFAQEGKETESRDVPAPELEKLFRQLDKDEYEERVAAAKQLKQMGPSILKALESEKSKTKSTEVLNQLKDVIGHLKRAEVKGGKEVAGIQAALRQVEEEVADIPVFELEIRNVAQESRTFMPVYGLDRSQPRSSSTWPKGEAQGRAALVEVEVENKDEPRRLGAGFIGGKFRGKEPRVLKPGESYVYRFGLDLFDLKSLAKGTYELKISYYAKHGLLDEKLEDLESNGVQLIIKRDK